MSQFVGALSSSASLARSSLMADCSSSRRLRLDRYLGLGDRLLGGRAKYLFFADYIIWCWAWAIACGDDDNRGRIAVINGLSDHFVADGFGQFVDRYILDKNSVA
jgi:hypothetical protein